MNHNQSYLRDRILQDVLKAGKGRRHSITYYMIILMEVENSPDNLDKRLQFLILSLQQKRKNTMETEGTYVLSRAYFVKWTGLLFQEHEAMTLTISSLPPSLSFIN